MTRFSKHLPRHGGDTELAARLYGAPADGWLDLSTGVNPWPYPVPGDIAAAFARFPTSGDMARLIAAARSCYAVPDGVAVAAAAGSELLIRQVPRIVGATSVALAEPTYRSHGEAWHAAGHTVTGWDRHQPPPSDAHVLVIANPNNPDGATVGRHHLAALADGARILVVDEAFADVAPSLSLLPVLAGRRAVVLRSFGKFFGLPGLRLGFAIGAPDLIGSLAERLGDWPVSTAAALIGRDALADSQWQERSRARLARTAARLGDLLTAGGVAPVGGTDLFQLIAPDEPTRFHEILVARGILTRLFPETGRIRIGLPDSETAWERLERALRAAAG